MKLLDFLKVGLVLIQALTEVLEEMQKKKA